MRARQHPMASIGGRNAEIDEEDEDILDF